MNENNKQYKSIGEVARILDLIDKKTGKLSTHTIRFWEKEFKQLKPKFFDGKRRYYDKKNIDLLKKIKFLLKEQGMTVNGVKKLLNNNVSNELDEISNKTIKTNNLRNKIIKISKIIKDLKKIK